MWLIYIDVVQHHLASITVNGNALQLQTWCLSTNSPNPSNRQYLLEISGKK